MNKETAVNVAIGCVMASGLQANEKQEVIDTMRALGQENCWISVEDQLPDRDDDYLVRHKAGHLEVAQYDLGRWLLHGEDGFLLPLTDKVTHWMSLPEPPKEADE